MLAGRPEGEPEDARRRTGGSGWWPASRWPSRCSLRPAWSAALAGEGSSDDSDPDNTPSGATVTKIFKPERGEAIANPFPTDENAANHYPVVRVRKAVKLYKTPGGRFKVKIGPRTEFESARILSVVERRGEWLAVLVSELDNGEVAWLHQRDVSEFGTVPWSIHVDLSRRILVVRRDGEKMRAMKIGIGRSGHSTPKGRYAVTDKLRITDPGSPYGCCAIALTGHQTKLPPGWPGGDRLAVHATSNLAGLGRPVSLGCMRTRSARHALDAQGDPARRARFRERLAHRSPPRGVKYMT